MEKKEEVGRDEDLDDALEAMFDEPSTPPPATQLKQQDEQPTSHVTPPGTPQETCIPQTPEPSPKKPRRKGVLEHLLENSNRLSTGAARVAQDLQKLAAAREDKDEKAGETRTSSGDSTRDKGKENSIAEAMSLRRGKGKKQPSKRAFTVIGKDDKLLGTAHATKTFAYVDANVTNMSLTESPYEKARLEAIFEHTFRVDLADIRSRYEEIYTGGLKDYTIFGCLVKKLSKKQSKKGKMFAIWSLCNMPRTNRCDKEVTTTVVRMYLFDEAYEAFHTRCEGTVFALRKPSLWAGYGDGDENRAQSATMVSLRISKKDSIAVLGVCKDFKLCESRRANGEICGQWYHSNQLTNCPSHEMSRKKGIYSGMRMDIQNAVRPSLKDPIKAIRVPVDISSSTREKEVIEQGDGKFRNLRDARRARDMRKRGREKRRQTMKTTGRTIPPAVQGGLTKRTTRKDVTSNGVRELQRGRNRLGESQGRLHDRNERQSSYHGACATLHRFGFKLRADGGWEPPGQLDIPLVTSKSHKFNGLGAVTLSFGGEIVDARDEHEREDEGDGYESRKTGNEKKDVGKTEGKNDTQMDVDSEERHDEATAAHSEQKTKEDVRMDDGRKETHQEDASNIMENERRRKQHYGERNKNVAKDNRSSTPKSPTDEHARQRTCEREDDIILSDESEED